MPLDRLLLAGALALVVTWAAYRARALTVSGAVSAWLVGTLILGLGGWLDSAALLTFFVTSSGLSRWRKARKDALGFAKTGRRDMAQVWANGGAAAACVLVPALVPHLAREPWRVSYFAALAAANADTWATEIGAALGGAPVDLRTWSRVRPGTSGAVSGQGLAAAVVGAALLALFALPHGIRAAICVAAGGVAGCLFDSVIGATFQGQWRDPADPERLTERPQSGPPGRGFRFVNNDLVNLLGTVAAIIVAQLLSAS